MAPAAAGVIHNPYPGGFAIILRDVPLCPLHCFRTFPGCFHDGAVIYQQFHVDMVFITSSSDEEADCGCRNSKRFRYQGSPWTVSLNCSRPVGETRAFLELFYRSFIFCSGSNDSVRTCNNENNDFAMRFSASNSYIKIFSPDHSDLRRGCSSGISFRRYRPPSCHPGTIAIF